MYREQILRFAYQNSEEPAADYNEFEAYLSAYTSPVQVLDGVLPNLLDHRIMARISENEALQDFMRLCRMLTMKSYFESIETMQSDAVEEIMHECRSDMLFITYERFVAFKEKLAAYNPFFSQLLTPRFFALLPSADPNQSQVSGYKTVNAIELINALRHAVWGVVNRFNLDGYCACEGVVCVSELFMYIKENYSRYHAQLDPKKEDYYVYYATKTIAFFLDPRGTGKIRAYHLLAAPYLMPALHLSEYPMLPRQFGPFYRFSWFTEQCFSQVYEAFNNAVDYNSGLLPLANTANLPFPPSKEFARRWFYSEYLFDGEGLDFRAFMDYALTITFPCNAGAGKFVFRVLDSENQCGLLTVRDVQLAFKSVFDQLLQIYSAVPIPPEVFVDEIFQYVKPARFDQITLSDVFGTNSSEFLVRYLVSAHGIDERERACYEGAQSLNNPGYEVK